MSKVKSAICLSLMTLLIAALCIICFVSFPVSDTKTYNSILTMTDKDADLGLRYGGADDESGKYLGGGFSAVYYPEGVISVEEYDTTLKGLQEEAAAPDAGPDKQEKVGAYQEQYTRVGNLYFDTDKIKVTDGQPDADFQEQFQNAVDLFTARYEALRLEDFRVSVYDGYAVRVFVSQDDTAAFTPLANTGELSVRYGSDASSAATIMPARSTESITDYIKGAHVSSIAGMNSVVIEFTKKGREALAKASADAEASPATAYFRVGESDVLQLSVSSKIDEKDLSITSTSFTEISAKTSAALIDTAINNTPSELTFTVENTTNHHAMYGENSLMWLYIAYGVLVAAMLVFFFVRYRLLGFAHLYTYLLFLCATVLCVWAIPFVKLSVETIVAVMLTSVLLSVSNVVTFEKVRAEYATGKTMTSSVKAGYKKCFWNLFDVHIVLAIVGFFTYFVALPSLSSFAFLLGLTTVFSGLGTLFVNRFNWAILMAYTPKKGAFCNFKREETEDE